MAREDISEAVFLKTRIVYDSMQDELSKRIFSLRVLYNLTGDLKHIKEIILQTPEFKSKSMNECIDFFIMCQKYLYNQFNQQKLIIYGAGERGKHLHDFFNQIRWYCFCDKDPNKQHTTYCGLPVISPEQLIRDHKEDIIVIGTLKYKDEIYNELVSMGFIPEHIICNTKDPVLSDRQYFESNIILPNKDEVFVDAGSFDCTSSLMFRKWCNNKYDKIYAFEPDPSNYLTCKTVIENSNIENIELFNVGLWSKKDVLYFNAEGHSGSSVVENGSYRITVVSLDEILNGKRVSFIKMDVEGSEMEALKGAKNTIITYRPKLAISVYHKPEDILQIPLYLQSLVPNYKFYIRHYSNYTIETVLYAI